jgi:hypothetical protein
MCRKMHVSPERKEAIIEAPYHKALSFSPTFGAQ